MAAFLFWRIARILLGVALIGNILWAKPPELKFTHLTHGFSGTYPYIRDIMEDRAGFIWLGSDGGGLYRYDRCELKAFMANVENPHAISSNDVISIYQDRKGIIWVGTNAGGLNRFDPLTGDFTGYYNVPPWQFSIYSHNIVWAISEDHQGRLWLGTNFGLNLFHPDSASFQSWLVNGDRDRRENAINFILVDHKQPSWLWLGTNAGLIGFDMDSSKFHNFTPPFWSAPVEDILQEPNGGLWLATRGRGMVYFDPKTDFWEYFLYEVPARPEDEEAFNTVFQLAPGDNDLLWLATRNQIKAFDRKQKTYLHYPYINNDSTSPIGAEYFSVLIDQHGMLWAGSYHGLSMSQESVMEMHNNSLPHVVISSLSARDRKLDGEIPFIHVDTLILDHKDRDFSLTFASINADPVRELEYAYQLVGKDVEPIITQALSPVAYRTFWGGEYVFEVQARYKGDEWGPKRKLVIDLEVPYWQKWWFSALILLSLASVSFAIYSFYLRQKKEKERLEAHYRNQLMEIEMSALRSQMNPHFLFNSLNSIKHFIIKNNPREASRYLTKFSQLMRQILNNSRSASVSLADELKALKLYVELEGLRFDNKFQYISELEEGLDATGIYIPPLILQPYVENAIWHGLMHKDGQGEIQIKVKKKEAQLQIVIKDNGVGREKAALLKSKSATRRKSHGMQITSDRLALVEAVNQVKTSVNIIDLVSDSGEALGTRVDILIPLEQVIKK